MTLFLDATAGHFALNTEEAGSAAAALLCSSTLFHVRSHRPGDRFHSQQSYKDKSILESRVKIASRKLFRVAILHQGGVGPGRGGCWLYR